MGRAPRTPRRRPRPEAPAKTEADLAIPRPGTRWVRRTSTACGSFRRTLEHIEIYQIKNVLGTKEKRTLLIAKNKINK